MNEPSLSEPTRVEGPPSSSLSLLLRDQRRRWQAGDRVRLEAYLREHPSLRGKTNSLLELLYHEVVLREEGGEKPDVEEYLRQFPELASEIRLQLEIHAALRSPGEPKPTFVPPASGLPMVRGYEVLELLGRGGMGVVYKARHIALNRLVALKMMAADSQAGEEGLTRFRREAQAIARLKHPHIVQIHEVGEQDNLLFLSLEYVDGGALTGRLDGTPWAAQPAAQLVEALARAMHYAHQQGVVHRDLKPANVLLSASKSAEWQVLSAESKDSPPSSLSTQHLPLSTLNPKVTDFGLAKLLREDLAGPTRTGELLGTPCYMAPEQVEGFPAPISPATDVYGLGAILYELLTGRPPFRADTSLATCQQILEVEPVAPSRLQPACPRDAETICLKCLQKEPRKRYTSAEALADDLRRFLEGRPIAARPVSWWGRVAKWARRRPAVAALLAGIVAVTLLGLAATSWKWREADQEHHNVLTRLYFDRISRAYQELSAHNVARANELLDECRKETPQLCLWEWDLLKQRCNEHLLELEGHTLDVRCVTYSPNGRLLASCSGEFNGQQPGQVLVWDAASGQRLALFSDHKAPVYWVTFHPDGWRLASVDSAGVVLLWDVENPQARPMELRLRGPVYSIAFSPDGKRLAASCGDGRVRVIDLTNQRLHLNLLLHGTPPNVFSVAYSSDGRYLASAGRDGWVCLVEAESGKVLRRFEHDGDVRKVVFSPDGRWLASGAFVGTIKLLDLTQMAADPVLYHLRGGFFLDLAFSPDGRRLAHSTRLGGVTVMSPESGHNLYTLREDLGVMSLAFRPDGRRLATAGENLLVKVWDLTDTLEPRHFIGHRGAIYSFAISPHQQPQRQQVAFAGAFNVGFFREATTVRLFDLTQQKKLREFAGHTKSLTGVTFHPNGEQLATASVDGTARFWDVATGNQQGLPLNHGGPVTGLAYSPNGKTLATSCHDGLLYLWNVADGRLLRTFAGHVEGINAVAFHPSGRYLVSGGMNKTIRVWEAASGRLLHEHRDHVRAVATVVFSWDGKHLASADVGQTLRLWKVAANGALTPSPHPVQLRRHADTEGDDQIAVLGGSRQHATSLAFSPDDQRLASVSPDRSVQLWDVATGHEVLTLVDTPGMPLCVTFSRDGRRLVLSAAEGNVTVWDTDPLYLKERARPETERTANWHWTQAKSAAGDKALFATIFHASRGMAAQPREVKWYNYRAWAHAEFGQWEDAQADYARASWLLPESSTVWYRHAIACLGAGDRASYHQACSRMLRHFAGKSEATMNCLYVCAPDSEGGGNPAQLVELGRDFVKTEKSSGVALRAYGAALYRARRYQDALQALENARAGYTPRAWDWLFLAMTHQQLRDDVKARAAFEEAERWIAAAGPASTPGSKWMGWFEQVEVEALHREAENLLRGNQ